MMTEAIMMSFLFDDAKLVRIFELCKFFKKKMQFFFILTMLCIYPDCLITQQAVLQ